MYTASSLDTERQYDHCKKPWEEESDQAVDSLLQALLTNKNNFADLFTQAANIRMKVAAKLNHDDGGFGEFRNGLCSLVEDFYYIIGTPHDEAWPNTKKPVKESMEELEILALDGNYQRYTDTSGAMIQTHENSSVISHAYDMSCESMRKSINNVQKYYRDCSIPVGRLEALHPDLAILASLPIRTKNNSSGAPIELHETEAHSFEKVVPDHIIIKVAQELNKFPDDTDKILSIVSDKIPPSKQAETITKIKKEILPFIVSPNETYRLINQKAVKLDPTNYNTLLKSLAKGLQQTRLSSDCLKRLLQMSEYHESYRVVTLQPLLNADKENKQQPISGQFLTAQYLNGELLSASFKAPVLTSEEIKEYWKYASYCFNKLIRAKPFDAEAFMLHSAKLMYTMAHFIPIRRGNAGVMQWILNAVAKYNFIKLPAFNNQKISWDFKAISSTEEVFSRWWRNEAFVEPPRAVKINHSIE